MQLPVRWYRVHPLAGDGYDESGFGHVARTIELDPARTALIAIDLWNTAWSAAGLVPELGRAGDFCFLGLGERAAAEAKRRTSDHLAPALAAARAGGLTVIYSNCEAVVRRYPDNLRLAEPSPPAAPPEWPPPEIDEDVRDGYYTLTYGPDSDAICRRVLEAVDIPEPVRPVAGDFCVCQQEAVDEILAERRITTVLHAGFLLSHCLLDNAGGIRRTTWPWRRPGYRDILLRDCTVAQEYHSTVDGFRATEVFTLWLESTGVPSTTSTDLCAACGEPDGD